MYIRGTFTFGGGGKTPAPCRWCILFLAIDSHKQCGLFHFNKYFSNLNIFGGVDFFGSIPPMILP